MRFRSRPARILVVVLVASSALGGLYFRARTRFEESRAAADAALARRDFASASRHLNGCLEQRGADVELILLAARTARRRSDFETARRHLAALERFHAFSGETRFEQQLMDVQTLGDRAAIRHRLRAATAEPWNAEAASTVEALIPLALRELALASSDG